MYFEKSKYNRYNYILLFEWKGRCEMVEQPAGFWVRLGANIIDGILILIAAYILGAIFGIVGDSQEAFQGFINLLYALILPIVWYGYTIGKRALGIRIMKVDGEKVGIGTMLLRTIVSGFVYAITFGLALIVSIFMVVFRKDKRSVHDMIANTYVSYQKPEQLNPYETE